MDATFRHAWESGDREREEILADVSRWTIEPGQTEDGGQIMAVYTRRHTTPFRFAFHDLYSLIGYGYSAAEVANWGLKTTGPGMPARIAHDYDGEVQRQPVEIGRDRLFPGYFGFGALLPLPNAQVIPGMLFRLPDLLVGVALRATEYTLNGRHQKRHRR